jgi:hypothetical protein
MVKQKRVNGGIEPIPYKLCERQFKGLGQTFKPSGVLLQLHNMHLVTKMSPFELTLGKEARKPMDLTIPMG